MAITHHFADASDFSKGGRRAAHYGETICTWTWDAAARAITVQCGPRGTTYDLSGFDAQNLDAAKLPERLPRLALEAAEKITGKKFDV
jgi:hypothetical protein